MRWILLLSKPVQHYWKTSLAEVLCLSLLFGLVAEQLSAVPGGLRYLLAAGIPLSTPVEEEDGCEVKVQASTICSRSCRHPRHRTSPGRRHEAGDFRTAQAGGASNRLHFHRTPPLLSLSVSLPLRC
jgi:hypothetical protein